MWLHITFCCPFAGRDSLFSTVLGHKLQHKLMEFPHKRHLNAAQIQINLIVVVYQSVFLNLDDHDPLLKRFK
jgi:hypothetical protein